MERIITGLKPTGDLTLGNYIGAIKQMINLQDKYDSFVFVADLHALTIPQDPKELNEQSSKIIKNAGFKKDGYIANRRLNKDGTYSRVEYYSKKRI